jgi:hypothetical protein
MIKKLLLVIVVTALSGLWAGAQEAETVIPISGRYSFELPEGWVSSQEAVGQLQTILPAESLILADSEATLEYVMTDQPDPTEFADFAPLTGSFVYAAVWPYGLFEALGMTGTDFATLSTIGLSPKETEFTAGDMTGVLLSAENENNAMRLLALPDSQGSTLLVFAFSPAGQSGVLDEIINTVDFKEVMQVDAIYEAELVEDMIFVDVPLSWWYMETDGGRMVISDFSGQMVETMQNRDFSAFEDIALVAQEMDEEDFGQILDEEGNIDPEKLDSALALFSLFGDSPEGISNFEVAPWTAADGETEGVSISMEMTQGVYAYMIILPGEPTYGLMGFTGLNSPDNQRDLLHMMVDSVRFAPAE